MILEAKYGESVKAGDEVRILDSLRDFYPLISTLVM